MLTYNLLAQNKTIEIEQLYSFGNYQQVIAFADSSLVTDSLIFTTWYYKALSEQALCRFKQAESSLNKALNFATDSVQVLYAIGICQESMGNDEKAIKTFSIINTMDSTYIQSLIRIAAIHKNRKEYSKAIECYSKLIQMDSTNGYFYSQLAVCCIKFGFHPPVVYYFEKALELNSGDLFSIQALITELIERKEYDEAQRYCDSFLIIFPNQIKLLKQQAYLSSITGNYIDASQQFSNILALGDTSQFTYKHHGQNYYNNGQFADAIFWLDKFLKLEPDDIKNHFVIGMAYQKDYQYEKSLHHFQLTMKQIFDKELIAKVFIETGNSYSGFGDYKGFRDSTGLQAPEMYNLAAKNYLHALKLIPNDINLYKILGLFYESKLKDLNVALNYFEMYERELNKEAADIQEVIWIQNKIVYLKEVLHL